jgi:hypothetical protein
MVRASRALDQKRFVRNEYGNFGFARISCRSQPREFVVVDTGGLVWSYDAERTSQEPDAPSTCEGSSLAVTYSQAVRIGGSIHIVGGPRRLYRRHGIGSWQDLTPGLKLPSDVDEPDKVMSYDWRDASGFSETDLYTVGGEGDVFHFDGSTWRQCAFPSNELLNNVCCAADGNVYIGGNMGSLYVGRGDRWKKLEGSNHSMPWKDIAFFGGTLYCGSDYGLWQLDEKGKLVRARVPADVLLNSGAMDVSIDGRHLLTAGPDGASLFDGRDWQVLFSRHDLE